jgi:hypothetical protein
MEHGKTSLGEKGEDGGFQIRISCSYGLTNSLAVDRNRRGKSAIRAEPNSGALTDKSDQHRREGNFSLEMRQL